MSYVNERMLKEFSSHQLECICRRRFAGCIGEI